MHPAIVSSRLVPAPRAVVFNAFTDPDVLHRWWGPRGFTNAFHSFDLRPGGAWRFTMYAPDGTPIEMVKEFVEILPLERIVVRHLEPVRHRFAMTMLFADEAGGTRLTWRMEFDDPEEAARVEALVLQANEENFDRLTAQVVG